MLYLVLSSTFVILTIEKATQLTSSNGGAKVSTQNSYMFFAKGLRMT